MTKAMLCAFLLAVAVVAASAFPLAENWASFSRNPGAANRVRLQQQLAQCDIVTPAAIVCQSARLTYNKNHSYIHVCPLSGVNPAEVCFNSKLPRCCPDDLVSDRLKCVSRTNLEVGGQTVQVEVHVISESGTHCIAFDDAHQNIIKKCCLPVESGLEDCEEQPTQRPGPVCVPKRDIYFVVDSTDSVDDAIFCRFGYVLQLIVAAINPQGVNGARVAAVLFQFDQHPAKFLFNLDDQCATIVNDNIQKLVYEYYGVKHLGLDRNTLTYPNVRATSTLPFSALNMVADSAQSIPSRPSSVITLTDGKSHQSVGYVINRLRKLSDPLIGAGIGKDVDETFLLELASNSSTVVYEPNRDNVIDFAKSIVKTMRDTAALCPAEAQKILTALNAVREQDLDNYCIECMRTERQQWSDDVRSHCAELTPSCGAPSLMMVQSVIDEWKPMDNDGFAEEWEKLLLKGEIQKAVEDIIAKVTG